MATEPIEQERPRAIQSGEHIFRIELRGPRHPDDMPLLYTADQLKSALDLGVVQVATFVGRIAGG